MRLLEVANGDSGGERVLGIVLHREDPHHFVEARNLEVENGAVLHQPFQYRSRGTKQLELDTVLARPAVEKGEHLQAASSDGSDFGKIEHNDAGGGLGQHNIAKLEDRLVADHPAFALNHCQVAQVLDVYGQHGILQNRFVDYRKHEPCQKAMDLIFQPDTKEWRAETGNFREAVRVMYTKLDYLCKHRIFSPFTRDYVQFRCV